jgi:hypothetical protein
MSLTPEDRRWEILARELPLQQIGTLRSQADGWRNGTAAAVTILAAVAIAKSRTDVAQLDPVWRGIVVGAIVVGFAVLMASLMISVRVAHGSPGAEIWDTGDALQAWTHDEVARGGRLLRRAVELAVVGLSLLITAMAVGWLAPAAPTGPFVMVGTDADTFCGRLVAIRDGVVTVETGPAESRRTQTTPLSALSRLEPAASC